MGGQWGVSRCPTRFAALAASSPIALTGPGYEEAAKTVAAGRGVFRRFSVARRGARTGSSARRSAGGYGSPSRCGTGTDHGDPVPARCVVRSTAPQDARSSSVQPGQAVGGCTEASSTGFTKANRLADGTLVVVVVVILAGLLVVYLVAGSRQDSPLRAGALATGGSATAGEPSELLGFAALIFRRDRARGPRLMILDETGDEVGCVVDDHSRSWLAYLIDRKVGIYDRNQTKVVEFVPPLRAGREPVCVSDGAGRPTGSIVAEDWWAMRFILKDPLRRNVARIAWERQKGRDVSWRVVVRDSWTREIGRITIPKNRGAADRLLGRQRSDRAKRGWRRRLGDYMSPPGAYLLLMSDACDRELRLLMLAAAAYLGDHDPDWQD
jgi:hypothetical protein